jgi:hypothetical protein
MATEQLLLRLPEELVRRFRRVVPSRERSLFVQRLLEQTLPRGDSDDDPLYRAALDVEKHTRLNAEMDEWESATLEDGLRKMGWLRRRFRRPGRERCRRRSGYTATGFDLVGRS